MEIPFFISLNHEYTHSRVLSEFLRGISDLEYAECKSSRELDNYWIIFVYCPEYAWGIWDYITENSTKS